MLLNWWMNEISSWQKMTERENLSQENIPPVPALEPVGEGRDIGNDFGDHRRRLLKVGAAAVPVVMTLLSRPAFGVAFECKTPSGFLSGNLSQHGNPQYCSGCTPGYWKNHIAPDDWPVPYYPTTVLGSGGHQATKFHSPSTFSGSFFCKETLLDVMQNSAGGGTYDLGNHISAALLNAAMGWTPTLSVAQVINIWSEFTNKGYFEPSAGIKWYADDIVVYLKSTML